MKRLRYVVLTVVLVGAAVAAGVSASGADSGQEVRGRVLVASPGGNEIARRAWLASQGQINGITGYAFGVAPSTIGGSFTLTGVPGLTGAEDFSIAFYRADGSVCALYQRPGDEAGTPCGAYAVAWIVQGADGSFIYRAQPSGSPPPTTPPPTTTTTQPPLPPPGAVTDIPVADAVAYQVNPAHSGAQEDGATTSHRLAEHWRVALGDSVSYALVAGGRVFATYHPTNSGYGTRLAALDATSGAVIWDQALSGTYFWSAAAYENGTVFALNYDGVLRAFDVATGTPLWASQMPGQYAFSSAPTAIGGTVYVGGAGVGGTLYAVDETNGTVRWTGSVENGDDSSPAVTTSGVYVSYACNQAYDFDPATGALLWHHTSSCEGGGGKTTAVHAGRVYTRDFEGNLVLDAATGSLLDTHPGNLIPAFDSTKGYFVDSGGTLRAQSLQNDLTAWSFNSDGTVITAPVVANGVVYVGTSTHHLDALDASRGSLLWQGDVGLTISSPDEQNVSSPLAGLSMGGGMILVPASGTLVAYA